MKSIAVQPVSAELFARFGDVLDPATLHGRVDRVARIENTRPSATPNFLLLRAAQAAAPHRVERMECHPFSSQTFVPFGAARALLAVAVDDGAGAPDLGTLEAFEARGCGFSYHAGIWHIPLAVWDEPVAFAVFMHEDGTPDDCRWAEVVPFQLTPDIRTGF